ncbi:MAG: glycosyltransferase family 2 protein [Dehalococcoidia bacterium]
MTLGVVIVTYRCKELALRCLASIRTELPGAMEHTVVVDNASGDGTLEAVERHFPRVRRVQKQRNIGFAGGANAGIRALAECDVVVLLNPDTMLLDGGLEEAAEYLREHDEVGVLGARIENVDGTLQPSCRAFPGHLTALFNRHSVATKYLPGNRWSERYLMTDWDHTTVRPVDWVSGACMIIHRRAIERAGVLDAHYFFSIEDVDYCRRVRDAGLEVMYFPMARVRHRVGGSSRNNAYRAMAAHHRGMWHYYTTHMRGGLALDAVTAAGIFGRLGLHAASLAVRRTLGRDRGPVSQPASGSAAAAPGGHEG